MIQFIRRKWFCFKFGHNFEITALSSRKDLKTDKVLIREFFSCKVCHLDRMNRPKRLELLYRGILWKIARFILKACNIEHEK